MGEYFSIFISYFTPVGLFEEFRFVLELIIACLLFMMPFAKRRQRFWARLICGGVLCLIVSLGYFMVLAAVRVCSPFDAALDVRQAYQNLTYFIIGFWYVFLTFFCLAYIKFCFKISFSELLFKGAAGYALQHIEYVLVNEVLALAAWPALRSDIALLPVYILISGVSCAGLYIAAYYIFAPKFRQADEHTFDNSIKTVIFYTVLIIVIISSTLMEQHIFRMPQISFIGAEEYVISTYGATSYIAALIDVMSCILVLFIQYSVLRINNLSKEKAVVSQILYENQKQYELSRENADIINRKCHDLKHQINALRHMNPEEREKTFDEVEKSVMIYDAVVKTENEVLNTILTEKSLYCEKHKITLSCVVDIAKLGFMSAVDLYALLGNALDNAIECVSKYEDPLRRVISLTINTRGNLLCIQTNNYFSGELEIKNELPVTTKEDNKYHGYGMKSMKMITEKYGGTLICQKDDDIFTLQIIIPSE